MDDFFDFNLADFPVNRFEFTVLVSQRVRLLASGAEPILERRSKEKDTILALREVVAGKLDFDALYDLAMKKHVSDLKADDELAGYKTAAMGHAPFIERNEEIVQEQAMVLDSSKATISRDNLFVDLDAIADGDDVFETEEEEDVEDDSELSSDEGSESSIEQHTVPPYEFNEDEDILLEDEIKSDEDE